MSSCHESFVARLKAMFCKQRGSDETKQAAEPANNSSHQPLSASTEESLRLRPVRNINSGMPAMDNSAADNEAADGNSAPPNQAARRKPSSTHLKLQALSASGIGTQTSQPAGPDGEGLSSMLDRLSS